MRFVYPEFLWAFLALAIPVIIHLFNFRRYKTLYFSSLQFLKFVDQQTRSTQKLKHYLVLALRVLFLSALIFAFAQPYIPAENNTAKGGKSIIAIYVDNSFSMTAKGTEGELISEAREFARKIIQDANLETRFLLHSNLLSGIEKRILTKPEALEYLDKIEPGPMVRSIDKIINWQRDVLRKEQENGISLSIRQHLLLSDFQRHSTGLGELKEDKEGFYYPIRFSPQERSNIFVDSVWFSSPVRKVGSSNELNIRLVNASDQDLSNVELKFKVDGISRDLFVDIPSNDNTVTTINYTEKTAGSKNGVITVNDRQLFWDDDYFFSYQVNASAGVLIVNGPSNSPTIGQILRLEPFYKVSEINENSFTGDLLADKELLIVNGLKSISSGFAEQLIKFAQNGGSVGIVPGADINLAEYNQLLSKLELPLLGSPSSQGTRIKKIQYDDRFFYGMFDKKKDEINLSTLSKVYTVLPRVGSRYFELIQLQSGQPLFYRSNNQFNAFVLATALDDSFGTFTSESLYPALILRMAELSQRPTPLSVNLGSDASFPLYNKSGGERPILLKNEKIEFMPRVEKRGITYSIVLSGMEAIENLRAGNYSITDEGQKTGTLSLNYNRVESGIDCFETSELKELMLQAGIGNISTSEIDKGQSLSKIDIDKPFEYWRLFVILALLFLIAEMLVLKLWK